MKIVLDNIIFSLQKSGGISILWKELIASILKDNTFDTYFLEYQNAQDNLARQTLDIDEKKIINKPNLHLKIERYKNPTLDIAEPFIFISSYYRTCKNKNATNITIVHDFTYEFFKKGISRLVHSYQKNKAIHKSQKVICISENTKKDLLQLIPNTDKSKIQVIHNGVSNDFYRIEDERKISELDKKFQNIQDYKYLLYVGHRTAYKNFDIVVKGCLKIKNKKYKLIIVGEPFTQKEQTFIDAYPELNYQLISNLNNTELNHLYNRAFALLYPSAYEGFGIPIIEAMKTHCPVIASNNSSIPEVAGNAALLYHNISEKNIAEAIEKLENTDFRNKLIQEGITQSQKFSWDKTCKIYLELFRK